MVFFESSILLDMQSTVAGVTDLSGEYCRNICSQFQPIIGVVISGRFHRSSIHISYRKHYVTTVHRGRYTM